MKLETLDWQIIAAYFVLILGISLLFAKKAGKSLENYFLGGRKLPWWVAGTSMVATTFAADTPLVVTELVAKNGISGNWVWWNMLLGGMLAVFFFAKLWRRANIVTDVEFVEIRYSGWSAAFLRGFKAIYVGIFLNSVIIAWVNVALMALLGEFMGIPKDQLLYYAAGAMLIVAFYSSISGLTGVAVTDLLQFVIAMGGCIVLAYLVLNSPEIGGADGLKGRLPAWSTDFFPSVNTRPEVFSPVTSGTTFGMGLAAFFAFIGFQWWSSWYPGAEPGGGGYIAQRMMSTKDEKGALKATLFFQIAHYCIRPWPWIIVGLCAIVLYPDLPEADKKLGYVKAMNDFLPTGLKGLLLVAFLSAYMSTISTQLNWGASYLVNDFYKRFIKQDAGEKQYVRVSKFTTLLLMAVSLVITSQIQTIESAFMFMIECGAGLGLVLILRWYWWRINAWSEIVATIVPFLVFGGLKFYGIMLYAPAVAKYGAMANIPAAEMLALKTQFFFLEHPYSFFITIAITTVSWLLATFFTRPTSMARLKTFYIQVRPYGAWGPFQNDFTKQKGRSQIAWLTACWLLGTALGYSCLFLIGKLIFKEWEMAGIYGGIFFVSVLLLNYCMGKLDTEESMG